MSKNEKVDLNQAKLWITPRSPFARRVRLAFLENEVSFQEEICDVFKPSAALFEVNPLGRVPALQLNSGQILVESHVILQVLYENIDSQWMPKNSAEKLEVLHWGGLAAGLSEKIVEYYLDFLRPKGHQDLDLAQELEQIVGRLLPVAEKKLEQKGTGTLVGTRLTQADLDLVTALTYLDLRYTTEWKKRFPSVAQYQKDLESRPSFRKTVPPPAA